MNDLAKSKDFFQNTLGLEVKDGHGEFYVTLGKDQMVLIYPKEDHQPATFTVLNFNVENLEATVSDLCSKGIKFLQYDGEIKTNEKGINKNPGGPNFAWFTDPFGISWLCWTDFENRNFPIRARRPPSES